MENRKEFGLRMPSEGAFSAIARNLHRTTSEMAVAAEKSFAHIKERAYLISSQLRRELGCERVLEAILTTDEAVRIYRRCLEKLDDAAWFDEINCRETDAFVRRNTRAETLLLCREIAKNDDPVSPETLISWLFGGISPAPEGRDRKVAFLRNRQASRAFERFAKELGGVSAVYEDNFQNACESVFSGQSTYAIIPIHSMTDGRLNSFYRQMEKYDLSIVMTCEIESDDGENVTTFALIYRDRIYMPAEGDILYECKITFDDLTSLADIADAAAYFGVTIESIEALPVLFSGRANAFAFVFGLKNADISGFFCYLALEYPQATAIGVYGKTCF